MMKTLLFAMTAIGISASAAFAECNYHKVNAQADVDQSITTASVTTEQKSDPALVTNEQLPEADKAAE